MSEYIESEADHAFTAFLSRVSSRRSLVLRERGALFSRSEKQRASYLFQKQRNDVQELAAQVRAAAEAAASLAPIVEATPKVPRPVVDPEVVARRARQLEIAIAALARRDVA